MSSDNSEEFFWGLTLDIMEEARPDEEIDAEVASMMRLLGLGPGDSVLDVPCGGGRHAVGLAAAGCKVSGIDISQPLLEKARASAEEHGVTLDLRKVDMRDLPWQAEFDAAICMWGSFGYFDDEGNIAFLRSAASALKPGGRFLIDTPIVETVLPNYSPNDWTQIGRIMLTETRHYDHVRSRLERSWTMMQGQRLEKRTLSIRLYAYSELCRLLREAGFGECEGYSTLTCEPFALGDDRVYMLASKEKE